MAQTDCSVFPGRLCWQTWLGPLAIGWFWKAGGSHGSVQRHFQVWWEEAGLIPVPGLPCLLRNPLHYATYEMELLPASQLTLRMFFTAKPTAGVPPTNVPSLGLPGCKMQHSRAQSLWCKLVRRVRVHPLMKGTFSAAIRSVSTLCRALQGCAITSSWEMASLKGWLASCYCYKWAVSLQAGISFLLPLDICTVSASALDLEFTNDSRGIFSSAVVISYFFCCCSLLNYMTKLLLLQLKCHLSQAL